jgi:DNA-binding GntR family transcriptional regulator
MHGDKIYQVLREEILKCVLAAGAELREQELAQRFGVSKSPVREALQHLVVDELVAVMPRQGYRVSPVSLSDAHDLFSFRQVLELACVAEATRSATDEQLAGLDAYRTFDADDDDHGRFIDYNRAFHAAVANCSGNKRMSRTTCAIIDEMDRLVRLSVGAMRGRNPRKLVSEHNAIIDAVQARNARTASNLLRAHTASAEKRLRQALEWAVVRR